MKSGLMLVAGHGGSDPGSVSADLIERDLNIDVVLAVNDAIGRLYLTAPTKIDVITYPATSAVDGPSGLQAKIDRANAIGADLLLVEVHHNAAASGTGAQVWVTQRKKDLDDTALVAPLLAAELGAVVGEAVPILTSDRSRFGKLGILDDTSCTAVLVECRNVAQARTPEGRYATGNAIARALAHAFAWREQFAMPDARLSRAKQLAKAIVDL